MSASTQMRCRRLLCAGGGIFVIAGCGGGGSDIGSDKSADGVRATLHAYLDDLRTHRGGDACDLLTPAARVTAGNGNASECGARVVFAARLLRPQFVAKLEATVAQNLITARGDNATATSTVGNGYITTFVYTDGHWRIDS